MKQPPQHTSTVGLTLAQRTVKRTFDVVVALVGLGLVGWMIVLAALWARRDTSGTGFFRQPRIGRNGRVFHIYKIRTMRDAIGPFTTVTTRCDPRITPFGAVLRHWKIDELPQLLNVLRGEMSLVGPRPDVPAYLDHIRRRAPLALTVRPGITGPASIKYRFEEQFLAAQPDPQTFNDCVLFPDKLRINEAYVRRYSFVTDLKYLWLTMFLRGHDSSANIGVLYDGQNLHTA
jgi:lipopolysaccharide/colanic/teichoic acid biosynthesis glycosyltransferase